MENTGTQQPNATKIMALKEDKPVAAKKEKETEEALIIKFVYLTARHGPQGIPALEGYEFFCDQYGTPSTQLKGIVVAIDSEEFHNEVAAQYYVFYDKIFGQQSWDKAKRYFKIQASMNPAVFSPLRCHARTEEDTHGVLRTKLYYDTGLMIFCFDGEDVKQMSPEECPVKFRRYKHTLFAPIRRPERRTDTEVLGDLLKYFNTKNFLPCLLPSFFVDQHSQPILCFTGAAGSAKSTFQTMIKRLVDPASGEKLNICDDKNDWVTMLDKFYILDFDNVRDIKAEEADILSRAVTGGSIIRRTLYTTGGVTIFSGKPRIMMNGIRPEPSQFNDLLDRMIIIEMDRISADKRLSDEKLWQRLSDAMPEARFVCLDLAAKAYRSMWTANHPNLPRLGEFARLTDAINVELHMNEDGDEGEPGAFIKWYFNKIGETASVGIEDDFANAMVRFLDGGGRDWFTVDEHSTHEWVSELLNYCTEWDSQESRYHRFDLKRASEEKSFPKNAVNFGRRLTEIIPLLNERGFHIRKRHTKQGVSYTISRM